MKIATFNINGVNTRLAALLQWLEESAPDVACLQELKSTSEKFPIKDIEAAGYGAIWQGEKSWNGVAILAKGVQPIEVRRGLPGNDEDVQSRYLEAAVDGVLVAGLYLPNGNPQPGPKFDYKLAWMERLITHAATLVGREEPVVICGDFNVVASDDPIDIYNPRSWKKDALLQPQTRERWQRLLAQGWTDAIAKTHPGEAVYTFWDYFRQHWDRDAGLRIDHLLLNAAAAKRLKESGVDREVRGREKPSDHAPTWIRLSTPKGSERPA
jgi:exodeoxyribonuclease-3